MRLSFGLRRAVCQMALATPLLLASLTGACRNAAEPQIPPNDLSNKTREPQLLELSRMYQAAQDQFARRAVSLKAIDEGALRPGVNLWLVDQIFGTHFEPDWAARKIDHEGAVIVHFVPEKDDPSPAPDLRAEARGFFGWFLVLEYDDHGIVHNYYLSNIHKGFSNGEAGNVRASISSVIEAYATANSEFERREICLRAIDQGVIRTAAGSQVSTIDSIFGTHLSSQLPTRNERTRTELIYFAPPVTTPSTSTEKADAAKKGWFMSVRYDYEGFLEDYYLTNIHK